jgi:predicted Na+-dependent transporter
MTTASTLLSFGLLPLFAWIYMMPFQAQNDGTQVSLPVVDVLLALLLVVIPAAIGIAIRWRSLRIAQFLEKFGVVCGVCGIVAAIVIGTLLYSHLFDQSAAVYGCAFLFPFAGSGLVRFFFFLYVCVCVCDCMCNQSCVFVVNRDIWHRL